MGFCFFFPCCLLLSAQGSSLKEGSAWLCENPKTSFQPFRVLQFATWLLRLFFPYSIFVFSSFKLSENSTTSLNLFCFIWYCIVSCKCGSFFHTFPCTLEKIFSKHNCLVSFLSWNVYFLYILVEIYKLLLSKLFLHLFVISSITDMVLNTY